MTMNVKRQKAMKAAERSGLRIGVTLFIRDEKQSLWENGIFQNCFFLLMLLRQLPGVSKCFIVNGGPGDPDQATGLFAGVDADILTMDEAATNLDVIIELSAQLNPDWARAFEARGGRIIGMRVANDFVIDSERMAHGLSATLLMSGVPYHQIWTLPAFEQTCAPYYGTGFRAPVRIMQHLWSPVLLQHSLAQRGEEASFAYRPGRNRWRIAIMEPNICGVKTCHLPLLACDVAHRLDGRAIEQVRIFCAQRLSENPSFVAFARATDLVAQGLATFEGRYPVIDILGPAADAIVSHHWENGQNYLYYEALFGGFPLIHNSRLIGDCGYYYRDFDPRDGASALLQALREHDRNIETYRRDASLFLNRLDPLSSRNADIYGQAIAALFAEGER